MAKNHKKNVQEATFTEKNKSFYYKYYKQLLIIPVTLLLVAMILIGMQYATTGDFVNKGISLKGGTSFTIMSDSTSIDTILIQDLEQTLSNKFPTADIEVRELKEFTKRKAITLDVDSTETEFLDSFKTELLLFIPDLTSEVLEGNVQTTGSSIGDAFFSQIIKAMILAFIFMGLVVFFQFRVPIPSLAVMLSAFSDIVITLAIINMMGVKLSTAGIAAFLMLIGYSVDTDILMTSRVLKGKAGTAYDRVISSLKTGLTMNITTLVAVTVALFVSQSEVITQIMLILFIGLLVDMMNTWIQNAGILRYYVERRDRK